MAVQVAELPGAVLTPPTVGPFATGAQFDMQGCGPSWQSGDFVKALVIREPVRANVYGLSVPGWHLYPSTLPEALSRTLARMQQRGVILVEGRTVTVLNAKALRAVADGGKV